MSFLAAIFFQTESRVSCPRELRKVLQRKVRQWRSRDQWVWCHGISWVRRKILRKIQVVRRNSQAESRIGSAQSSSTGNWGGEMNLQAQPAPGNRSEARTSKSEGERWNSTSPTISTLKKKSLQEPSEHWISQNRHQWLVLKLWRPTFCNGDFFCRHRQKPPFIMDKLHWKFGSIQEHKLRGTSEFIWYLAEIDIGPSSWDTECDTCRLDSSFTGEIYTFSRSGDQVDEPKVRVHWDSVLCLGKCQIIQKRIEDGKIKWQTFDCQNWTIFWNWRSDWDWVEYFPGLEPEKFEDRIIFMSMFNDLEWTKRRILERCVSNSEQIKNYPKRFARGHWTFIPRPWRRKEMVWKSQLYTWRKMGFHRHTDGGMIQRNRSPSMQEHQCFESWKNNTIHFNADASNTELFFQKIHSANQLSIYGAVSNWCEEFGEWERADFGKRFVAKENEQLLKNVKLQEVNSLVQTPRSDDPASGNRLRECLQNFETQEKSIQFTKVCGDVSFWKRVSIGTCCKTIPDVDNGFGDRTSACTECTHPRAASL